MEVKVGGWWRVIGLIFINYKRKKWWFCSTETWTTLSCAMTKVNIGSDVNTLCLLIWQSTKGTAPLLPRTPARVWPWGSSRWARSMTRSDSALPSVPALAACGYQALGMWPVLTAMCYIYTGFQKIYEKNNINRQFVYWLHFLNDIILKTIS